MVTRDADFGRDFEKPNDKQNSSVLEFNSPSVSERMKVKDSFGDLIRSLSDSYENRRARQTSEWETLRRQNLRRAS